MGAEKWGGGIQQHVRSTFPPSQAFLLFSQKVRSKLCLLTTFEAKSDPTTIMGWRLSSAQRNRLASDAGDLQ